MIKRIFTFLGLCILIGIAIFIGYKLANQGIDMVSQADSQTASTSLLVIQAKQKVISEKSILEDTKDVYVGEQYKECTIPEIENFKNSGIIAQDDEHFDSYYVWNQEVLNNLNVNINLNEGQYYIVNYETNEVIDTAGVNIDDQVYYKLSEIKEIVVK